MGSLPLRQLLYFNSGSVKQIPNLATLLPASVRAATAALTGNSASGNSAGADLTPQIDQTSPGAVYPSQSAQRSLAAQFQEIAARLADVVNQKDGNAQDAQAQQLTFGFTEELRSDQLAQFTRRTSQSASGLSGSQQQSYLEVSQKVAAQFKMSITMSGAALNGFVNSSEHAMSKEDVLARLMEVVSTLLDAGNDAFDEFMSNFDGVSSDTMQKKFNEMFQNLLDQFFGTGKNGDTALSFPETTSKAAASQFDFQLEFSFASSTQITVRQGAVQQSDPIMFDLDNDGYELSSYTNGANFDITGSGKAVNTAFVNGGDAFLAIDRNGNGQIDSGKELFGDQNGAANGFEELRKLDSNKDGKIDSADADFKKLWLFKDNGDGKTGEGELISLKDAGIVEISLDYRNVNQQTAGGNKLAQLAAYRRADGSTGTAADAVLNYTV
jgi:hypothetical protein